MMCDLEDTINVQKFPSPIGELHFSMDLQLVNQAHRTQFPSPIGELHFSINDGELFYPVKVKVSVPYRGATFLNIVTLFRNIHLYVSVSVPYRGATFLNMANN